MTHILVEQMSQLTTLSDTEKADIERAFPIDTFEKGAVLLREGQITENAYSVIRGCIREYVLIDGVERVTAFYTENQSAINFDCLANHEPSKVNYVCGEETTVAIFNSQKEAELYDKHPRFETFCRQGMEEMMGVQQSQLTELLTMSPEERYEKLQDERADLLNRVPQYQIASYLGIKPETLSRIRRRIKS